MLWQQLMTLRVIYNYILKMIGLRDMLPGDILRSVPVRECGEPMVVMKGGNGLFIGPDGAICRKSVAEKLYRVANEISKKGMGLYVYELYRTPEQQQSKIQKSIEYYSEKVSDNAELEKLLRRSTAGVGGGHQTGGAVDLTLCTTSGTPLDMGSRYPDKCPEMATSYNLPEHIRKHREILCRMMEKEGFANYPGEWWHFSYGDQLWAAYKYKRYAIYGVKQVR